MGNKYFRHAIFLGICLQVIQQLTGINVVMYYAPKIFKLTGFTTNLKIQPALNGLLNKDTLQ
ncbi:hypothetical protein DO021_14815 [Desulfobacter hydrogenophilus]|uniref:MFS transporter n=1 Tax=Desulfobacter hydrogenophilus TaxID=2291 RepID=A0A328FAH4_9BACT|nr:MFS transporter [Desulfobacter hydrogenophilus]NDY71318.1 MFS transporter [Desulfobacter hydrogenophilus]QBH12281.1 hypothetical protein EYB58_04705 [Desulfobacter hydrogenophilus]RAM01206.1 hypothetical protein DO021_14815 [Desulfobacter hydrogenophilus]